MLISLLNQKGGVGKTTLAVHLAEVFSRLDKSVLLVDADPQGSALDWAANRPDNPPFPVIGLPKPTLHRELPAIAKNHDFVLIDGPPRVNELARAAIMASDVVEALSSYPVLVLKTSIGQRVAFAESAAQGLTVLHTDPSGQASQEIVSLAKELLEL